MQHHKGNSDRPDETGETIDWLSIYRHGHDGEPENPWSYVFLNFFRDNPAASARELRKRGKSELLWGNIELVAFATTLFIISIELALRDFLPSAVLLPRPLLQLLERLLPALRCGPR